MNLKSRVVTLVATLTISGGVALVPIVAVADHTTAHTIEQLTVQIAALQAQLLALSGATPAPAAGKCSFTRSLTVGSRGDDVTCLQDYLTGTGHFTYSGGSTGYFGGVTKAAVAAWQAANGVAPAAGYFGPISQAKYDSMVVGGPAPTPTPGPTPGPVVVGSGLTVTAAAEQPSAQIVPEGSARAPFVKAVLTASADGDVTVKSLTVERRGLADDAAFDSIILLDDDGTQIGNSKTLSSDHKVTLSESFSVKAGTSKTISIAANMAASLDNYNGQVGRLAVVAVDAGTTQVNASLPIEGNGMTFNSNLSIGTVTMSLGSLDPGAANTKNVGTKAYYLASIKASVGSAEDVTFEQIRFNQAGSVAASDLENVMVKAGDKEYPATISADGKYYISKFTGGLAAVKGATVEFSIKADLMNGSARTVDMDILKKSDIVVKGKTYGYYILAGGGTSGSVSAGNFSSNQEPYFNSYVTTINKGSLLITVSNSVPATNVPIESSDTVLGAFTFDVKGEDVQITAMTLSFDTFTGGSAGTSSDITGVKLFNDAGSILAGPKDPSTGGVVAWTDTFTLPVGVKAYTVKAKLDNTFDSGRVVRVALTAGDITAKGAVTGLTITPTPSTKLLANAQTVRTGALALSVSPTPVSQNIVKGVSAYHFATYVFDATNSGEDVRVSSVKIRDTIDAANSGDEINSCQLFDGATALNTGGDVSDPSDPSSTTNDLTITLTNNLVVSKGTVKNVDLKCNISSAATAASTHSFGINDTSAHNVTGATTNQSITESVTTSTGQIMTVKAAGSFTVAKNSSSPTASLVLAGKTEVPMVVWKFHATDEPVRIDEVTLQYSTTTASTTQFSKATLWDGTTKVGEAVWAGSAQYATSTLNFGGKTFVVDKDSDKLLSINMDLSSITSTATSSAGRLLSVHYSGYSSSSAVGLNSGVKLGSSSNADFAGDSMQIQKSLPTLARIAVPNSTVPQNDAILYRFSVKADAAGPVGLYKLTFNVSSSTPTATSSNFRLYAFTDSAFSVAAYQNNPVHAASADCAGLSVYDNASGGACAAQTTISTTATTTATTTEVVFFFNPSSFAQTNTESVIVPAGATYYFQMRGDITNPNAGTGNSISVRLLGDVQRPARTGGAGGTVHKAGTSDDTASFIGTAIFVDQARGAPMGTAIGVAQGANTDMNNFVWSPLSTSTVGATSTPDWTNGFRVPGLPSTGLDPTTFTN